MIGDLYRLDGVRFRGEIDFLRFRGDFDFFGVMDFFFGDRDFFDIDFFRDDFGEIDFFLDDFDFFLGDLDFGEGDFFFDVVFWGFFERGFRCGFFDFFLLDFGDREAFRCEDFLGDFDIGFLLK